MGRAIAAVVVAEVVWSAFWIGGSLGAQAAFPDVIDPQRPLTHAGALLSYIAYSVAISVLAGYLAAAVKGGDAMRTVWVFAWIQLALGIGFEASAWSMTPVWYHLVFLALLVPATVWGGRLRVGRPGAGSSAPA